MVSLLKMAILSFSSFCQHNRFTIFKRSRTRKYLSSRLRAHMKARFSAVRMRPIATRYLFSFESYGQSTDRNSQKVCSLFVNGSSVSSITNDWFKIKSRSRALQKAQFSAVRMRPVATCYLFWFDSYGESTDWNFQKLCELFVNGSSVSPITNDWFEIKYRLRVLQKTCFLAA